MTLSGSPFSPLRKPTLLFKDQMDDLEEEIDAYLEAYTLDDILEDNDTTITKMLAILIAEGYLILPDAKPV